MAFSRKEDFPESTLADDGEWLNAGRGRTRAGGGNRITTPLWRPTQGDADQDQRTNTSSDTTPQLRPSWARELVDIDKSPLTSIGRANSTTNMDKRWNQGRQSMGGSTEKDMIAREGAPIRQETPFVQGVQVLGGGQQRREESKVRSENPNKNRQIDQPFDPSKEPIVAHPYQLRPTPTMYAFAQALFKRNVKDWKLSEIITPGSSDGRSILVSAFVDYVSTTLKPDIAPGQQLSVAQIAVATAPQHILEYLQDPAEARGYMNWVLKFRVKIPPTMETLLCPLDTPNLIEVQRLRSSIRNGDLAVEDQKHVIEVFVKCYYPKAVATVMEAIDPLDQTVLKEYIEQPGRLLQEMRNRRKAMPFAPPKWYRLSIHPGTVIPTTPRQQPAQEDEGKGLQVSLADIELKTKLTSKELAALPLPQMRTAILAAIPLVFEERLTREGCAQAFNYFETASQEQILTFLRIEAEDDDRTQRKAAILYRHLLRFEHTDKRQRGEWKEPAREILRQWIDAIHPVLVANNCSLLLSLQPASRNPLDRLVVSTPFTLEAEEIERHILIKKKISNPNRFEVWVKSSCGNLKELIAATTAGPIEEYTKMLAKWRVSVDYLCSSVDDHIPIFFLVGSITTADDELIAEEIVDRLAMADFELDDIPPFHVESSIVGTSMGKIASRTKCVIATKADSKQLQEMISTLHTPASRNRYVVTRDFQFAPIVYPPTDRSDSDLASAIDRQDEFTASVVRTTIYGYKGFTPFYDIPSETKDLCTRETITNTSKTVAQLLLTMKMLDKNKQAIPSPVIRVSENKWSSKIYLTALKKDAPLLIRFTKEVINLIDTWYRGHKFQILGDVKDAQKTVDQIKPLTVLQQQALSNVSAVKYGVTSPAQMELDASRTSEALVRTATKGIANTFARSNSPTTESSTLLPTTGTTKYKAEKPGPTRSMSETDSIRQELAEIKGRQLTQSTQLDEITTIVRQVLVETEQKTTSKDMISTITTMLESKSPLSSVTDVATSCRSFFNEHSTKLHEAVQENSKEIMTAILNRPTTDNMDVLNKLVLRQEQAAEKTLAAERAMAERYDIIVKLLEEQKDFIKQISSQLPSEPSVDYGCGDEEIKQEPTLEEVTTSILEKYNTDVRQHARDLLALHESMPYAKATQMNDETQKGMTSTSSTDPESTGIASATTDVCKQCGKKDLMLIYCDKCPTPVDLYHPDCLHHDKDSQTRICQGCVSGVTGSIVEAPPTTRSDSQRTGNPVDDAVHKTNEEHIEEVASHHSTPMSISSSSSSGSSSSSSVEPYNPTYPISSTAGTPRARTLPSLKPSNLRTASTSDSPEISPLQTRAQRARKKKQREDAFDSSDDDEEIGK